MDKVELYYTHSNKTHVGIQTNDDYGCDAWRNALISRQVYFLKDFLKRLNSDFSFFMVIKAEKNASKYFILYAQ